MELREELSSQTQSGPLLHCGCMLQGGNSVCTRRENGRLRSQLVSWRHSSEPREQAGGGNSVTDPETQLWKHCDSEEYLKTGRMAQHWDGRGRGMAESEASLAY